MADVKLGQNSFTGGIWSRILDGRTDFAKHGSSVKRLENFIVWPHGPATFRPGFRYVATTKTSSLKSRILPFEFSVTQAYIIEAGLNYFRFYKDKAQIVTAPSTPYEVASTYATADLPALKYTQSADILYLFHNAYASRKLSRTGHTAWTLAAINWNPGPMSEQDILPAATLTLSATTGESITFTAGSGVFLLGDVGRIIKSGVGRASITAYTSALIVTCDIIDDFSAVGPIASQSWSMGGSPNASLTPSIKEPKGAICTLTSGTDLFRAADVGKFIRINSGAIKITAFTSAKVVKGEILKVLSSVDAATAWTLEAEMWNATNGYASAGTFFEERLMVGGSIANPETVWGSVVGDYENHTPGIDDSDAVQFSLLSRKVNTIRWLEPRDYLMVGTSGSEWRVGPEDTGTPLTPLNVIAKPVTTKGCADIMPITVDGSTIFVQRNSRKIRELAFDFAKGENGGYNAPDLTQLAEHLTIGGITAMAYQEEPFPTFWFSVEGGNLIGLTYLRDQEVVAWHEHPMDNGEIEDLAVIPGDGYDEVWAIIKRTINGSVVRYIEVMENIFTDDAATYTTNKGLNAFFVDSGITYNGVSTVTITGLSHLEGEEVAILADGAVQASKTVASGQITLDTAATVVHAGLPYTGVIETLRLDASLADGTAQSRKQRIVEMFIRVKDSGVFEAGRDEINLDDIYDPERTLVSGAPYPLYSGDLKTNYEGTHDRDARIFIVQDSPMPLTVQSIFPEVEFI